MTEAVAEQTTRYVERVADYAAALTYLQEQTEVVGTHPDVYIRSFEEDEVWMCEVTISFVKQVPIEQALTT